MAFPVESGSKQEVEAAPAEVGVDVGEAVELRQGEQDARRAPAVSLPAEAAVADAAARRTPPVLPGRRSNQAIDTQRV